MNETKDNEKHFGFLPKCVQDELIELYVQVDMLESKKRQLVKQLENAKRSNRRKILKKLSTINKTLKELVPTTKNVLD